MLNTEVQQLGHWLMGDQIQRVELGILFFASLNFDLISGIVANQRKIVKSKSVIWFEEQDLCIGDRLWLV